MTYFITKTRKASGEYIELLQLAAHAGGQVVDEVPPDGDLIYQINMPLELDEIVNGTILSQIAKREGRTIWLVGNMIRLLAHCRMPQILGRMNRISPLWLTRCHDAVNELRLCGIHHAHCIPNNEINVLDEGIDFEPNTICYSGFVWQEKRLDQVIAVAELLPDWRFTVHATGSLVEGGTLPDNIQFSAQIIDDLALLRLLARHEFVWIPREPSQFVYPARSTVTAVCSGSTTVVPWVALNMDIPPACRVTYWADETPQDLVRLFRSHPRVNRQAVRSFANRVHPKAVWRDIEEIVQFLERRATPQPYPSLA